MTLKIALMIGLGIVLVIALVIAGLGTGWLLWGRRLWTPGIALNLGGAWNAGSCAGEISTAGRGPMAWQRGLGMMWGRQGGSMMPWNRGWSSPEDCAMSGSFAAPATVGAIDIDQAAEAIKAYVEYLGYTGLEIDELMEFEQNFYAIVREQQTGTGAMELLVNRASGAVSPEMGPNMMWNTRYGMHARSRIMGALDRENAVSEGKALELAQRWLDTNLPGVTTEEHADPFYGYYTIHTVKDGEIEGMLSVHGQTGQIWYHTWHGAFIQMVEGQEDQE